MPSASRRPWRTKNAGLPPQNRRSAAPSHGPMPARHQVESYKFWDVVTLWAKEQLEAEEVIARALAKAVIRDGLRLQSTDIRWAKGAALELRGEPFVGFYAAPESE